MKFGTTPAGEVVERHVITDGRLRAAILTYGATLQSLDLGGPNLVLGLDTLDDYLRRSRYFGAVVGRYGNRIAYGRFTLDGATYQLPVNDGKHSLHGGTRGFDKRVWQAEASGSSVRLAYVSPDGEEGYPGTLSTEVVYTVEDGGLRIDYRARTDAPTVVNLTNHAYFDLSGRRDIRGHVLTMAAGHYLPVDDGKIPTGELAPVEGTAYDFTSPHAIGDRLDGCYDHCFVLDGGIRVEEPVSGLAMDVTTTEPGVQFYTGHMLDGVATPFGRFAGFCLETQHFPDSPNQPAFPSTVLRPGEELVSTTTYRFSEGLR
ncbi:galactose mutarotase [Streptosporangiaceae bacterium NEAU-GS5]|nr:galactose mutarotase [Streptosporangiaceae bacterium NEAU-GS5]